LQRPSEVAEVRDQAVQAGGSEVAKDPGTRDDQPHLAVFGDGSVVGAEQRAEPGRIAVPGPGQVDHERPVAADR
jgi:hypothetical protein